MPVQGPMLTTRQSAHRPERCYPAPRSAGCCCGDTAWVESCRVVYDGDALMGGVS